MQSNVNNEATQGLDGRADARGLATTAQAAAFLSVSRTTLWRLSREGVISPVKIGRATRFRWADLHRIAGGAQ